MKINIVLLYRINFGGKEEAERLNLNQGYKF